MRRGLVVGRNLYGVLIEVYQIAVEADVEYLLVVLEEHADRAVGHLAAETDEIFAPPLALERLVGVPFARPQQYDRAFGHLVLTLVVGEDTPAVDDVEQLVFAQNASACRVEHVFGRMVLCRVFVPRGDYLRPDGVDDTSVTLIRLVGYEVMKSYVGIACCIHCIALNKGCYLGKLKARVISCICSCVMPSGS